MLDDWLPAGSRSRGVLEWKPKAPVTKRLGKALGEGRFARFFVRVDKAGRGKSLDQFFEVTVGNPGTGWVINFGPGQIKPFWGNTKLEGRYRAGQFSTKEWVERGWNELKVARCPDGQGHLWLNGKEVGLAVPLSVGEGVFRLRSGGLGATVTERMDKSIPIN
jgi:hypothetical protein